MAEKQNFYPHLAVKRPDNPSKLYAFPLFGFVIKIILLIPVFIVAAFYGLAFLFFLIVNPFVILFTGNYWDTAYNFFLGFMKFGTKLSLYIYGLTDKYPGFGLDTNGLFELDMAKPTAPNRWLSLPLFGFLVRVILLIPYGIFGRVMENGSGLAMVLSWFAVTVKGNYPESLYEFERDTIRVSMAEFCYITALSDTYPSFRISMNHQTAKILLLIAGAILLIMNMASSNSRKDFNAGYNYNYHYDNTNSAY